MFFANFPVSCCRAQPPTFSTATAFSIYKYELSKLKVPEIKQRFVLELKNRFSCLTETESDETGNDDTQNAESVDEKWSKIKKAYCETAKS